MALMFTWFILSSLLFESVSDYRKTNKGWGCVEKVVETTLSIQNVKNNVQQIAITKRAQAIVISS